MTPPVNGSLATKLDFGELPNSRSGAVRLRLAPSSADLAGPTFKSGTSRLRVLRGPDKYKVLEHRRHQAQIKARRLLDLAERTA